MRFYGRSEENATKEKDRNLTIRDAFAALHRTRIKDNRPIGKLLGDAVMSSIQTLLMIGGFIILFSVINKLLFHLHITVFLAEFLEIMLVMLGMAESLSLPFISGLFEITLGSQMTSQIQEATLMHQAVITSFILAFSGFSVQAQVASILAQTDIRFQPFFFARIIHGIFSAFYAFILWKPIYVRFFEGGQPSNALPVMEYLTSEGSRLAAAHNLLTTAGPLITIVSLLIYVWLLGNRILKEK
ncbi:membrane protein [Mesobacillus boroniphilus JCM 21738]|uniref:Membrane protein n=1 Tax=Mesobacillus boroniphilus JCM 21738 TaxID=1294265 RepID=W4RTT8_9BACI|nr:membrane protein [Mesobacillus boroniphilus JCM 21738]